MYYSVTFDSVNTWEDWHLIPSSPPMVEPPKPYTNFVEIPGRSLGPIDLSEALSNGPTYESSTGSWKFIFGRPNITRTDRMTVYEALRRKLHNKRIEKIVLEEDPTHYYKGRFAVEKPETGRTSFGFTIKYTIDPVRYNVSNDAVDANYP